HDDDGGGPPGRAAPGARHRSGSGAAAAPRHHHRRGTLGVPAADPVHYSRRLPLPGALPAAAHPPPVARVHSSDSRFGRDIARRRRIMKSRCTVARRVLGLGLLLVVALGGVACSKKAESKAEPKSAPRVPPVPVAVAVAEQKAMPVQIQAIGSVEAYTVVSVKAQVGGELVKVHFKEGQDVKKGDQLFTIDRRPFEAALAQA